MEQIPHKKTTVVIASTIAVASLGYFVDIYDLIIFSVVRSKSLMSLGVAETDLLSVGLNLLNWMLVGMLFGGIFLGMLADKKGRLKVLFGSIILYSVANIANAYVTTVEQYRILRFIAGFGLAGELGVAVTLVSEIMTPKKRGYGTMLIAVVGMLGAVLAACIGQIYDWRTAYIIGGVLGLALLVLAASVFESGVFKKSLDQKNIQHGNFFQLFTSRKLFVKYFKTVFIGIPVFFVIGILITGAPEFGKALGMKEIPSAGIAVMVTYICISLADILCSGLSQILESRKIPLFIFLSVLLLAVILFLFFPSTTLSGFYMHCGLLGTGLGLWAVLITSASEQFGTNLRATVTTATPNFMRALLIPLTVIFQFLQPAFGIVNSAAMVGIPCILIAFTALYFTKETFGRDLDFNEE